MKKLVFLFLFICSLAKGQEQRLVSPQLLNWDSSWKYWLFDESSTNTCLNSQFYFETFYDPSDLNSRNFKQFQYFLLFDDATFDGRIRGTELAATTLNEDYNSHHSLQELFPSYNWSSVTSSKVFYIVVYYTTTYKCANTNSAVAPWNAIMTIKRKFYPNPKNGTIKVVPDQVTAKTIEYNTSPGSFSGTEATGGDGGFSYQWQKKEINGSWVDIYNAVSTDYYPTNLTISTYFRRRDTPNKCGPSLYTNEINITVLNNVSPGTIGSSQTVCYGSSITLSNDQGGSGGTGTYNYQWLSSTDGVNFQNILDADEATYTANNLKVTTYFRRKCTSGANSAESNIVKLTVRDILTGGDISSSQTICYNVEPAQLVGAAPTGGDGTYTFTWEYSLNGTLWFAASNGSSSSYQPEALTSTTYFRRTVTSGSGCGSVISSPVTITVRDQLSAGIIGSDQTICYATSPAQLMGGIPSGGDGNYTYIWESSINGSSWDAEPLATGSSYQPGALTATTYYRRTVTSGSGCGSRTSSNVTISVYGDLSAGSISSNQTICNGVAPALITCSAATGGNGSYTYAWEQSINGTTWDIIPGFSELNYQHGSLTTTTMFRRTVTSGGGCGSSKSSIVTVNVRAPLSSGTMGSNQVLCYNSTPVQIAGGTPTGGDGNYTYKWEWSTNGTTWNNITSRGTEISYQPGALTATTYYRRTVTSGSGCGSITSPPVTITVNGELTAGVIGSNQTICHNSTPAQIVGSVATGGDGTYTYKWELSANGSSWDLIPGASEINYLPGALSATTYYRRTVTSGSGCGSRISSTVSISVNGSFAPGNISSSQTVCYGVAPAKLTGGLASGGFGNYVYQWKQSADGQSFIDIPGANDINFQPGILTKTVYYKRAVTCGCGTKESSIITIVVNPELAGGDIVSSQTICYNTVPTQITGAIPIGGDGTYTYKWEFSTNGATWDNISNITSASYQPAALKATTHFRRTVTSGSGCGVKTSSPVVITVNEILLPGNINSSQAICYGSSPALITGTEATGGGGQYKYQWKGKDGNIWNSLPNGSSVNFQPGSLTKTTYFRRFVTSGCGTVATDSITVEVKNPVNPGSISGAQTVCFGSAPGELTGTKASGGFESFNYQWQLSFDNVTYNDIASANERNYQPGSITSSSYFRRKTSDSNCGSFYSDPVLINTMAKLPTPNVFYRAFYCEGANVKLNAGNDFTYNWYDSKESFLKTGSDFTVDNIRENKTIFVKAQNSKNCISDAQQIVLNVDKVVADFAVNTELSLGEPIQFVNHSSNATRYVWDFSEGEQSTESSPWHIFNLSGEKRVKLISFSTKECSDTLVKSFSILTTGINWEQGSRDGVSVYPNPVRDILHIELKGSYAQTVVSIFNMQGVLVYQAEIQDKIETDISHFAPGVYTMLIKSKENTEVIKIVKQ